MWRRRLTTACFVLVAVALTVVLLNSNSADDDNSQFLEEAVSASGCDKPELPEEAGQQPLGDAQEERESYPAIGQTDDPEEDKLAESALSALPRWAQDRIRASSSEGDFEKFIELANVADDLTTRLRVAQVIFETKEEYTAIVKSMMFEGRPLWKANRDSGGRLREDALDTHWRKRRDLLAPYCNGADIDKILNQISGGWSFQKTADSGG